MSVIFANYGPMTSKTQTSQLYESYLRPTHEMKTV